ncbi:hypothetical protein [Streptomyces scopuliridis]|uniref:Extensin n=1 Tax=Streptomyces scopuliridis RB72 TaxID=1440053 RepID=A0A2T7SN02_9ACTN|nr:hypothetical protein [Streptomyces scopuliridis]PVE04196.1 hypothetical protein Y717_13255 [Streptomyces scopuliridis RB72]
MADERDPWLDRDAAERLLRGEPVETADEHVRARSEQLSEALRDMSAVTYANETYATEEELPGEAAALAAFRKAVAEGGGAREVVRDRGAVGAGAGDLLGTVRIALAPRAARAPRFARPMRRGLAAAVAGCALGGIAVAAGAGVLPPIFGDAHNPAPANSVSAVASPRPLVSGSPDGSRDPADPSDTPSGTGTGQPSPPPSPSHTPGDGHTHKGDGRGEEDGEGGAHGTDKDHWPGTGPDAQSGEWFSKTLNACRAYRDGVLDPKRKEALESATDGPEGARRFCDRLLDGDIKNSKNDKGGQDGDGGKGEGDGGDDGEGDGGEGGGGEGGGGGFVGSPGVPTQQAPPPPPNWTPAPYEPPSPSPVPTPSGTPVPTPSGTAGPSPSPSASATGPVQEPVQETDQGQDPAMIATRSGSDTGSAE